MALTWDLTKINNYEEFCWPKDDEGNEKLNSATESLIWLTMFVGFSGITETNAEEFYSRVALYEKLHGAMRIMYHEDKDKEYMFITPEDVYAHIGLRTNASSLTANQFRKNMFDRSIQDNGRKFQNYLKSLIKEEVDV
jgi:hypothetical protein